MFSFENEKKINISNNHWCNYLLYNWCHCGSDHPNISQYMVPDFKSLFLLLRVGFLLLFDIAILTYGNCIGKGMVLWYPTKPRQKAYTSLDSNSCSMDLVFGFLRVENPIGGLVVIVALFFFIRTVQQFKTIELFARATLPIFNLICFASLLNGGIVFLIICKSNKPNL